MFTITEELAQRLAQAGVTKERALEIAAAVSAEFPDLEVARVEFERRIREELEPSLDPVVIAGLLIDGWKELRTGHPGYNPHHFGGA